MTMSLIKCPDCGSPISSLAHSCPKCGYPIIKKQEEELLNESKKSESFKKKYGGYIVWSCLLVSIFMFFYWCNAPTKEKNITPTSQYVQTKQDNESINKQPIRTSRAINDTFIKEKDFGLFQAIIQQAGLVCRTCEGGHSLGEKEYGWVFRVYCNGNSLVYKVTVNENGNVFVKPWDE